MMLPSSPPGLSAKDVEKLITAAITEYDQPGKTGWVRSNTVSIASAGSYVDIADIPTYANEILLNFQGVSTSTSSGILLRVLNESGAAIAAGYNGFFSTPGIGSSLSGSAQSSASHVLLSSNQLSSNFTSGLARIVRHTDRTWFVNSTVYDAAHRQYNDWMTIPDPGVGITGLRMLVEVSPGVFDAGRVSVAWRQ